MPSVFWAGEVMFGAWTVVNFCGVLFCSSERGKHLREIEGDTDKKAIEMRVANYKEEIKSSKQRSL